MVPLGCWLLMTVAGTAGFTAENAAGVTGRWQDWFDAPVAEATVVLTSRLDEADYLARRQAVLAQLDREKLATTADIAFGFSVKSVFKDSQASSQGIQPGDLILAVGGQRSDPLMPGRFGMLRDQGEQELLVEQATGRLATMKVRPGFFGINYGWIFPRFGALCLTEEKPGQPWDEDLIVAGVMVHQDQALAETALARAWQSGYRGAVGTAIAAALAHYQFNHDLALVRGQRALGGIRRDRAQGVAYQTAGAALMSGRLATAARLIAEYRMEGWFPQLPQLKISAQLRADMAPPRFPIEQATLGPVIEMKTLINPLVRYSYREMNAIRSDKPFTLAAKADELHYKQWGPRVKNGMLSIQVTLDKARPGEEHDGSVDLSLRCWHGNHPEPTTLIVQMDRSGLLSLFQPDVPALRLGRQPGFAAGKPLSIQIAMVDRTLELSADGKRIYVSPAYLPRHRQGDDPLGLSWNLLVKGGRATFAVHSWRSVGKPLPPDAPRAWFEDPLAKAQALQKADQHDAALEVLTAARQHHDWNVEAAIGDELMRRERYAEARTAFESWASSSGDPIAWLFWGSASLLAEPTTAPAVVDRLRREVRTTETWAYVGELNRFVTSLRQAGQVEASISFLIPLERSRDANPPYQLFCSYLALGDWRKARLTAARIYEAGDLNALYRCHVRFVDAALAIKLGDEPPSLDPIREIIDKGRVPPTVALALAYFGGALSEQEIERRSATVESGVIWRYYRGLRALALNDHATARQEFESTRTAVPNSIERWAAGDLLLWLAKNPDRTPAPTTTAWPYQRPDYAPDPPAPPTKPGADDF